jgi:hypothetical protein
MGTIEDLARKIDRDLTPQFEERLREALAAWNRDALVDELVRLSLEARNARKGSQAEVAESESSRDERLERIRALGLNADGVRDFAERNGDVDREQLIEGGYLAAGAPPKGTALLTADDRSETGNALLQHAKDVLFALLFGDEATDTRLDRVQQELLTLAIPRPKAEALDFMQASTELAAAGTWQDPESVSNDERADNVLLEVQFGETADEVVGGAIIAALSLINNLEINEQVLYARMINVEESTLID